ncbi:peptidyl-tRNA hydrolase 2, mitochondrial, partial [Prunus avium]|uniref:peptidyl-tRNA hydrolase n=1 Tax=Prunus avium TaxID=42229 RepID=A0A6P5SJE8_PRUAV
NGHNCCSQFSLVVNVHNTDPAASRQHRDRFRFPDSTHPNLARNARPHALTCSASYDLVHCKTQRKDKLHGHGCVNSQPSDLGLLTSNNTLIRIDSDTHSSKKKKKNKDPLEIDNLADILQDFKMVLVVRNDLKMGKGKIAAQCSHATLGLYKKLLHRAPKALNRWEMCAQPKVVVKIESEEDMLVLQERAKSLKLPTHITIDAGRTQIAPNSRTVMAILGPVEVVDDVTGGLKLL